MCADGWPRPHLAGAAAAQLVQVALANRWVRRLPDSRAAQVTPEGRRTFAAALGHRFAELSAAA